MFCAAADGASGDNEAKRHNFLESRADFLNRPCSSKRTYIITLVHLRTIQRNPAILQSDNGTEFTAKVLVQKVHAGGRKAGA